MERKKNKFAKDLFGQLTRNLNEDMLGRIVPVDVPENFFISDLDEAVVSVHARWSGPSIIEGTHILKLLEESEDQKLPIYIIDHDLIPAEMQQEKLGFISHGYFESVFVKNGEIVCNWQKRGIKENQQCFYGFLKERLNVEQ